MYDLFRLQMTSALMSSFLVLILQCTLLTCSARGYIIENDVIDDTLYEPDFVEDISGLNENDIVENKRAQFSLNGELRSLAEMVLNHNDDDRSVYDHTALLKLGKRNWRFPSLKFGTRISNNIFKGTAVPIRSKVSRRRSQQLSVSGPLSALANMLAAEGHRRKQSESAHNRMRLLDLGKRSSDFDISSDDDEYH